MAACLLREHLAAIGLLWRELDAAAEMRPLMAPSSHYAAAC